MSSTNTCDVEQAVLKSAWEEFQEGVRFRAAFCNGNDPFSSEISKAGKTPKQVRAEEDKETNKLSCLIKNQFLNRLQALCTELKNMDKKYQLLGGNYTKEQFTEDLEQVHKMQFDLIEKIVKELKLPYNVEIKDIKKKGCAWRIKHSALVVAFTRRLRRALPYCLKVDIDRGFIPNEEKIVKFIEEERSKFAEDLNFICTEAVPF